MGWFGPGAIVMYGERHLIYMSPVVILFIDHRTRVSVFLGVWITGLGGLDGDWEYLSGSQRKGSNIVCYSITYTYMPLRVIPMCHRILLVQHLPRLLMHFALLTQNKYGTPIIGHATKTFIVEANIVQDVE